MRRPQRKSALLSGRRSRQASRTVGAHAAEVVATAGIFVGEGFGVLAGRGTFTEPGVWVSTTSPLPLVNRAGRLRDSDNRPTKPKSRTGLVADRSAATLLDVYDGRILGR